MKNLIPPPLKGASGSRVVMVEILGGACGCGEDDKEIVANSASPEEEDGRFNDVGITPDDAEEEEEEEEQVEEEERGSEFIV